MVLERVHMFAFGREHVLEQIAWMHANLKTVVKTSPKSVTLKKNKTENCEHEWVNTGSEQQAYLTTCAATLIERKPS